MSDQWACSGGKESWDGHPLVYIPNGESCPYCGEKK